MTPELQAVPEPDAQKSPKDDPVAIVGAEVIASLVSRLAAAEADIERRLSEVKEIRQYRDGLKSKLKQVKRLAELAQTD